LKTRYIYTDFLGVVEVNNANKSYGTPDLAKCACFKEKKQKLLTRLNKKQKEIGENLESLTAVEEQLKLLKMKYPEEFL